MAILPIVLYPDPVLLRPTQEVDQVDDSIRQLVEDMTETVYAAPGIGLAANQVGESLRVCVVDLSAGEQPDSRVVLINPVIKEVSGQQTGEEGCLSFPEITFDVTRSYSITVEALGIDGEPFTLTAEDLLARVILHECEHLEGQVFLRNLSPLKRGLIKKRIRKLMKSGDWVAMAEP